MTARAVSARDPIGWLSLAMLGCGHSEAGHTALKSQDKNEGMVEGSDGNLDMVSLSPSVPAAPPSPVGRISVPRFIGSCPDFADCASCPGDRPQPGSRAVRPLRLTTGTNAYGSPRSAERILVFVPMVYGTIFGRPRNFVPDQVRFPVSGPEWSGPPMRERSG